MILNTLTWLLRGMHVNGRIYPLDEPQAVMCFKERKFSYLFENLEEEHEKWRKTRMLETAEGRK
jgi:hypothetical protein